MGWERRGSSGRYFYRKRRVGARVISEYLGGGPSADLVEAMMVLDRDRRDEERRQERAARDGLAMLDHELRAYGVRVDATVAAVLTVAGYHRPSRRWRKRRMTTTIKYEVADYGPSPLAGRPFEEVKALLDRAMAGERAAIDELRSGLGPEWFVRVAGGNLAELVAATLADLVTGKNALLKAAIREKVGLIARELGGDGPSPVVRLLAERAAIDYADSYTAEAIYAAKRGEGAMLAILAYQEKRVDRAHNRYLRSLATLAAVRRLEARDARRGGSLADLLAEMAGAYRPREDAPRSDAPTLVVPTSDAPEIGPPLDEVLASTVGAVSQLAR